MDDANIFNLATWTEYQLTEGAIRIGVAHNLPGASLPVETSEAEIDSLLLGFELFSTEA